MKKGVTGRGDSMSKVKGKIDCSFSQQRLHEPSCVSKPMPGSDRDSPHSQALSPGTPVQICLSPKTSDLHF